MNFFRMIGSLLAMSASATVIAAPPAEEPKPFLLKSDGQEFHLVKNWTFGNKRPDATVRNKADLDQEFFYRYIWEGGKLDKFKTYWSYHRDYAEGDPKSLHVFTDSALVLHGRIPEGGGLREGGIESGMLRGKLPVTPGMYIEMRAKLPGGVGAWPSFWLEQGVQYPDGTFSQPSKPLPEIDIFEFFNWDDRPQTRLMTGNIQIFGDAAAYGYPHDIFTTFKNVGYEKHLDLGFDCSKEFHVFALDWVKDKPIWLLDGKPIKQTYYEWHGPPAHVTVVDSLGMNLPYVKQTQMVADEKQWNYAIDYIRIWERKEGAIDIPAAPISAKILNSFANTGGRMAIAASGKWENPAIAESKSYAATLKANSWLKVDITVPPDADEAGWFSAKLAINGDGFARAESPTWVINHEPGKSGINQETLSWDLSEIASKLPENPGLFKIELVTQGDRPRTIQVSNLRAEIAPSPSQKGGSALTIAATGKWQSPVISASPADVAKLKANPLLKVDISVSPDAEDAGWFMAKLAINGPGMDRTESPKWLLDRHPGKTGIKKETLTWDVSAVVAKLPANPNWFKIELVTQGDHPRTIQVSNIRAEGVAGPASAVSLKMEAPAAAAESKQAAASSGEGPIPYPDPKNEGAWPGKGPIRAFGYMTGEREAIWRQREKNRGAVAFVGDSLIGGWKGLAQAFPALKVANCGVGGDVSRGVLFRFREDVLALKPRALVINVGFNDLTAYGDPAQAVGNIAAMLDQAWAQNPAMPVIVCTIPPRDAPQAPIKTGAREDFNARLTKLAEGKEHLIVLDMVTPFTDAGGKPKPEFFANDHVHLVAAGYEKWSELLRPIFEKLKLQ